MKGGVAIGAAAAVPGMASASDSGGTAPPDTSDSDGVETEVIAEGENYKLYRTDAGDRVSLGKFYTGGPKEGKLEHVNLNESNAVEVSTNEEVTISQATALETVESSSIEIVERSKNVNRELDSCSQDYCDGFTYTHVQTGFSVEFTDATDALGKNAVAEAVSILADIYLKTKWARWVSGLAGIVAGTLLSIATGAKYTVSPWDQDKGWVFTNPVVELGVSNGWDTHANNLTNIQDNERAHIGSLDGRCG
ncbi:hypothetical protein [Halostella pelagica]|uniref:hypothetical protein n=1 Tax=Halostella pelagica TaxID=2583824 RepID=UPI00107FE2B2|nr:hypothetical protein [Halostella pelagica]